MKLKFNSKVKWTNLFTLARGLQTLSKAKSNVQHRPKLWNIKRKLKCPCIFEQKNPVTGKVSAQYVTFEDSLAFTYSTPWIVKHMKLDFEGQPEPIALNAIYADGTEQTKHIELTDFLCGNLIWDGFHEIQRLSRSFTSAK